METWQKQTGKARKAQQSVAKRSEAETSALLQGSCNFQLGHVAARCRLSSNAKTSVPPLACQAFRLDLSKSTPLPVKKNGAYLGSARLPSPDWRQDSFVVQAPVESLKVSRKKLPPFQASQASQASLASSPQKYSPQVSSVNTE